MNCLLAFAAGASLLLASLTNFLLHNDYPLFRPDVAIVATALLLIAAVMAPFYMGQRQWGRSLLDGVLVLLFADLNGVPLLAAVVAGLGVGLFTWWRRISLSGPLALFATVVLMTKLAGVGGRETWLHTETHAVPRPQAAPTPKFAILHLILDEQAGVNGIYPDAHGLRLRRELKDFFLSRSFTLYGRAYSEHVHTVNAVPAVLNFGTRFASGATRDWVKVGKTVYFDRLAREGFKIHILQNDFADLCTDNPVSTCTTYDSSSLRPTLNAPLSTVERAQLIGLKFLAISNLAAKLWDTTNTAGRLAAKYGSGWSAFEPGNTSRTSTVGAVEALPVWSDQVRQARPGDVYFAHLLLPHYPHVLRSDCSYLPWNEWELRRSSTAIEERRRTYAEQDRCTLRKVDQLIGAFQQSAGGRAGVVIVHGDHGSRIFRVPPVTDLVGYFNDEDLIAAHATLFAVRGPRTRPRYDETPQAITALLRSFVESDFQIDPEPSKPMRSYILSNRWWKVQRRAELPRNW
jgi:hypothetical protein